MKTNLLNIIAATALGALTPAQADENKNEEKSTPASASSSVTTNADGTATVTIEVNGKKETKSFKLGDKPFSLKLENGDLTADAGSAKVVLSEKKEKVTWLGIATEAVGDEVRAQLPLKEGEGLIVTHVASDSPAAKAGIEVHDIITRFDSQILVSADQLKSLVKMHKPGDNVKISALRKGQPRDAEAALEEHVVDVKRADAFGKWLSEPGIHELPGRNFLKDATSDKEVHGSFLREKLNELKAKIPDVVVDRKAFLFGPDGKLKKFDGDFKLNDLLDEARKHVDEAKISGAVREQFLKSVESAVKAGSGLLKDADSGLSELKRELDQVRKELEKTKDELAKAREAQKP